jgi:putative addiction module component (TIGR02574 family)
MTRTELEREVLSLPLEERLELAETIWASLEQEAAQPGLPAWQRDLLDERIADDDAEPDAGSPWEEVKRRTLASL